MSAAWKQDYPNIKHYYIHQIWPGACGSRSVEGDRLRERQRKLPQQFSNMSVLSTLGIRPGGGCHFQAEGYSAMARQLFPLVNQYSYGIEPKTSITPPNIESVSYLSDEKDKIQLIFDQDLKWDEEIIERFYLDDSSAKVTAVGGSGKIITLQLAGPSTAKNLSYVRGGKWRQEQAIIWGSNDFAALTFCEVPIQ